MTDEDDLAFAAVRARVRAGECLALYRHGFSLASWLRRWVRGELSLPLLITDEETGVWRHETEADRATRPGGRPGAAGTAI
ncbi:hypothetical protein ACWT_5291 [Actinoplanes sp. SE50]|uniref:hypothetical protein n=1 Tax=unclassified Actinoplanes TaxID=2626549 RepID=UPI00023EBF82|nr:MULTISPECIES: hypothetical protein [unclassified Actinoplanes]AEV86309.1 hypothetical protein ACPL_5422 [Actinoplanes sp. SE50/110]ATO84706.1 hypothetical protein ACWT_5291 [Actinoplanes sp. SE50]SLM02116.1 hypothetical protein ACSP50_5354 [Actinoplanes sp. SE50/110]